VVCLCRLRFLFFPRMYGHPFQFRGGYRHPPPPQQSANPNNNFFQQPALPNVPNPNSVFFQPPLPPSFSFPNTSCPFPPQNPSPPPPPPPNPNLAIEHADRAIANACRALLAAGDSVSAWTVSQNALLTLQVDSWNTLGIKMQQVPSLHRLMMTEGKVYIFISYHSFRTKVMVIQYLIMLVIELNNE